MEVLVGLVVVDPPCTIFGIRAGAKRFAQYGEESCSINLQVEFRVLISEQRSYEGYCGMGTLTAKCSRK